MSTKDGYVTTHTEPDGMTVITVVPPEGHFTKEQTSTGLEYIATPGSREKLSLEGRDEAMRRFRRGDWGDVDAEDWAMNAWNTNQRSGVVLAQYQDGGTTLWIHLINHYDAPTVLLPDEY